MRLRCGRRNPCGWRRPRRYSRGPGTVRRDDMNRLLVAASILALSLPAASFAGDPAETFKSKCSSCHGEDGKAQTKMGKKEKIPDFTTDKFQSGLTDAKI